MNVQGISTFDTTSPLIRKDGEVHFVEHFIECDAALAVFEQLLEEIDWHNESIRLFGRSVQVPRLVSWYGDPGSEYTYSGVLHSPKPWTATLAGLKTRLEKATGNHFNSVLCNLYRTNRDSMGWHADKETELGDAPFIASLSLGDSRTFLIRHNKTKEIVKIELGNGSLLLMGGSFQSHWRHCIPKTTQAKTPRINLTFRRILKLTS